MFQSFRIPSLVVVVIGVGLFFFPQSIEIHPFPEIVVLWNSSTTTSLVGDEHVFSFETSGHSFNDGYNPSVFVYNREGAIMNATISYKETDLTMNDTGNQFDFYVPMESDIDFSLEGTVETSEPIMITASLTYLRPTPSDYMTIYPYRSFGLGMFIVGIITVGLSYWSLRNKEASSNKQL
jgi:hypothetical protein